MAHFHTPSTGHSSYRTPPNTATNVPSSTRRSRQPDFHPSGALFDAESSEPASGYLTGNTRSARYPSTPHSSYRSSHPHYSDEDDDEPSESEPMTQRGYAPPNSANTRRLPLIGQTMSLGYGGTRSHNDPALTQPPLPQRRPRPMSDNFSSQPAYSRYGHIPPSPTPRSPAELHMYSDPSYPATMPSSSNPPPPSGNFSTHSLPPVTPYCPGGVSRQPPAYPSSHIHRAQPGNIVLNDSDTETDTAAERWAMV